MKRIATLLIAGCAVFSACAEDYTGKLVSCFSTKDDRARLACYDKLRDDFAARASANAQPGRYQPINIADLKVDAKDMVGKHISVKALIQTMGEMSMLKSDELDMAPIWANVDKLPREDRKKLMNGCQVVLCGGDFSGVIQRAPMGMTLVVDSVAWH